MKTVDEVRMEIEENGLDPRLLIIPPPLAVDFTPGDKKVDIPNMNVESAITEDRHETKLMKAYFKFSGSFVGDIIESYNNFIRGFRFPEFLTIRNTNIKIVFNAPRFTRPTILKEGRAVALYPAAARGIHSYLTKLYADVQKYSVDDKNNWTEIGQPVIGVLVAKLPVMVGSILCRTHGLTDDEKMEIGEDPHDPQGYFIVQGFEKTLSIYEALRENRIFLYESKQDYGKECRFTTTNNINKTSIITQVYEYHKIIRCSYNYYPTRSVSSFKSNLTKKDMFGRTLNILHIFRIFGVEEDIKTVIQKYILRFVKREWRSVVENKLAPTIYNFNNQSDYLTYVLEKFSDVGNNRSIIPGDGIQEMRKNFIDTCRNCFLPHMLHDPDENRLLLFGLMIARFLEYSTGLRDPDDRDDWGAKQFSLQGRSVERLFVKSWRRMISITEKDIDNSAESVKSETSFIAKKIDYKIITNDFESAFIRAVWGVANDPRPESNMTETLIRQSQVATLTHLTKIAVKTVNTNPNQTIRSVQQSQFNYVCPVDTPERIKIGIVKHRAIGCVASMERSSIYIQTILKPFLKKTGTSCILNGKFIGACDSTTYNYLLKLRRTGVIDFDTMLVYDTHDDIFYVNNDDNRPIAPYLVVDQETEHLVIEMKNLWGKPWQDLIDNGAVEYVDAFESHYIKLATDYNSLKISRNNLEDLRNERERILAIDEQEEKEVVNLAEDETLKEMNQNLEITKGKYDQILVDKKKWITLDIQLEERDKLQERVDMIKDLKAKEVDTLAEVGRLTRQIKRRTVELSAIKASKLDQIREIDSKINKETSRRKYTHMMLSPDSIFSFSASIVPLPGTLLATRVSYQCSKGNQALGIYASNFMLRMDHSAKVLVWPSRPIFKTHMHDILGMGDLPGGETAVIAITPWGGYNQEDAIIVSEHAVKRGLFSHIVYHVLTTTLQKSDDFVEKFGPPPREGKYKFLFESVGEDGLPIIGKHVKEGQAYCCKHRKVHGISKPDIKAEKISFASEGMIERIVRTTNYDGSECIRVKVRQIAKPLVGDKINLASGSQKSTISVILPDDKMPYFIGVNGSKIYPDLLFNPHSIPSRRTIGTLMEILMSKAAVYQGRDIDATGFRPVDLDTSVSYLKSKGFDPYGRETMFHPETGKPVESMIFVGLAYYNVLPQMVKGKVRARNKGPLKAMTRQPSRGGDASTATGLRLGTQESTALLSHGASELMHERFVKASDEYVQPFCITCGRPAPYNINTGRMDCEFCGDKATYGKVSYPYPFKTVVQLLEGTGLGFRFGFDKELQPREKHFLTGADGVIINDEAD